MNIKCCEARIAELRREQLQLECADDLLFSDGNGNLAVYEKIEREITALSCHVKAMKGPNIIHTENLLRFPLHQRFNLADQKEFDSYKRMMEASMKELRTTRNRIKFSVKCMRKSLQKGETFLARLDAQNINADWDRYVYLVRECRAYRAMGNK